MSLNTTQLMNAHLSTIIRIAMDLGIYINVGSDFADFANTCRATPGKDGISPAFDPDCTDVNASTGMWMTGHRKNGEVVLTQAIKLLDLNGGTLSDFLEQRVGDIAMAGVEPDLENSRSFLSPDAMRISGTVTYHGELWLKGDPDGVRGGCLATIISRLMLMMAWLRWSPNYMIGVQGVGTACGGLAIREGYLRVEQRSILLKTRDNDQPIEGWLVWMNKEEAAHNLRVQPELFYDLLEKDRTILTREQSAIAG